MESKCQISLLKEVDPENLKDISGLLLQLSPDIIPPSFDLFTEMIQSPGFYLFVTKNEKGSIVGMLSLVCYSILADSGKSWIEDVVVDENYRKQGIGEALVMSAIEKAKELNIKSINLTSRPTRKEANLLYEKVGFKKRETNCYKYEIK